MKKALLAASVAAVCALPVTAMAQTPAPAPAAKAEPDYTLTANVGLFSDYRFRGFTQTDYQPAIQGGFDFAHKSGFYLGNWNSNVSSALYNGAPIEMDFYGGYKHAFGAFGLDVGVLYYYYPGTGEYNPAFEAKNFEAYIGGSWGPLSVKYFYSFTDFFGLSSSAIGIPGDINTKGSQYVDFSFSYPFEGTGFGVNAHAGYQNVKNYEQLGGPKNSVWDYKVGGTYEWSGFVFGLAWVGTSEKKFFYTAENPPEGAGKSSVLAYVTKTF
jgi:uncharacterized protein (TIGR02001 family)